MPATLVKHVKICEKTTTKKRKIFDSSRQRREGTDLALLPPKPEHIRISPPKSVVLPRKSIDLAHTSPLERKEKSPSPATSNKSSGASSTSQQIHQHVMHTEKRSSLPSVVKRSLGPVTDQCPHCERFFGVKAYDR